MVQDYQRDREKNKRKQSSGSEGTPKNNMPFNFDFS
jgi:hypothetical protein